MYNNLMLSYSKLFMKISNKFDNANSNQLKEKYLYQMKCINNRMKEIGKY